MQRKKRTKKQREARNRRYAIRYKQDKYLPRVAPKGPLAGVSTVDPEIIAWIDSL